MTTRVIDEVEYQKMLLRIKQLETFLEEIVTKEKILAISFLPFVLGYNECWRSIANMCKDVLDNEVLIS